MFASLANKKDLLSLSMLNFKNGHTGMRHSIWTLQCIIYRGNNWKIINWIVNSAIEQAAQICRLFLVHLGSKIKSSCRYQDTSVIRMFQCISFEVLCMFFSWLSEQLCDISANVTTRLNDVLYQLNVKTT